MTKRRALPMPSLVWPTLLASVWSCSIYDARLLGDPAPNVGLAGSSGEGSFAGGGVSAGNSDGGRGNATGATATSGGAATAGAGGGSNVAGAGGDHDIGFGGDGGAGTPASPCVATGTSGVSFTPPQVFEAEDADLSGGAVAASGGTDTSGGGYVDMVGKEGSLTWLIQVTDAGQYKLTWKYAQLEERDMALEVNCVQTQASVQFNYTGAWSAQWKTDISRTVALNAGTNRLVLATNGGSGPNFDTLKLEKL